jgi:NAD(P)-dependent dehydrogenase (short-subunit alcohol dehydrogenase family)
MFGVASSDKDDGSVKGAQGGLSGDRRGAGGVVDVVYAVDDGDLLQAMGHTTKVAHNAGTGLPGEFLTIDRSRLREIVQLNVLAHLDLTHHFGQHLAERRCGGVLLVSALGVLRACRTWPTTVQPKPMY